MQPQTVKCFKGKLFRACGIIDDRGVCSYWWPNTQETSINFTSGTLWWCVWTEEGSELTLLLSSGLREVRTNILKGKLLVQPASCEWEGQMDRASLETISLLGGTLVSWVNLVGPECSQRHKSDWSQGGGDSVLPLCGEDGEQLPLSYQSSVEHPTIHTGPLGNPQGHTPKLAVIPYCFDVCLFVRHSDPISISLLDMSLLEGPWKSGI